MALHSIELCAGVGMLGEGVRAGFEFLGLEHRTVCYVEREAPAAAQLVTLMEAGVLDPAPVWSDMLTFDGRQWRGKVHSVIAGFPCQDLSVAGRRAGLGGERSGLFFRVLDIADDCGASILLLENVSGIATATAAVVDEEEGELEERAASRVVGELADRGWDSEWITLSASDVGASHGRARWFCLAWRVDDSKCQQLTRERVHPRQWGTGSGTPDLDRASDSLAHACNQRHDWEPGARRKAQRRTEYSSGQLANASIVGRKERSRKPGTERQVEKQGECQQRTSDQSCILADSGCSDARRLESISVRKCGGTSEHYESSAAMADTSCPRFEGREQRGACLSDWGGQKAHGPTSQFRGALPLFAPGPSDPRWSEILNKRPDLAPATEPGVRLLADGMDMLVDESRSHQLRQIGNGVVPLCAATALIVLARRAGIFGEMRKAA